MRHLSRSMILSVVPALILLSLHRETHFYIDPGTGSIVLQAVIGGLAGALVVLKLFWRQINAFFDKSFLVGEKRTEYEEPKD